MAKIGPSKGTKPERILKMMLVRAGAAFACQRRWGPDGRWIADFGILGCLIDVHGWHWHHRRSKMRSMSTYWQEKLRKNRERDRKKVSWAKANGLVYLVLWDYDLTGPQKLSGRTIVEWIRFERLRSRHAPSSAEAQTFHRHSGRQRPKNRSHLGTTAVFSPRKK